MPVGRPKAALKNGRNDGLENVWRFTKVGRAQSIGAKSEKLKLRAKPEARSHKPQAKS